MLVSLCIYEIFLFLVLQSRWKQLEKQVKKHEKLSDSYFCLKKEMKSLDTELDHFCAQINECDEIEGNKMFARFYQDIKIKMIRMKPRFRMFKLTVSNLTLLVPLRKG